MWKLFSAGKAYKRMRLSASISQSFYINFKGIFWRNSFDVCFSIFLDFYWQFLHARKAYSLLAVAAKDLSILHLTKVILFLLPWKKEN